MPPEDATPTYSIGTHLFLRVLGVVFAVAFVSAWAQIDGLVGTAGLLPAGDFLRDAKLQLGPSAYWQAPSLCWIFGTGYFLKALCLLGVLGSAFLFVGIAPALSLGCLWALYLSLCSAGQLVFDFQWDARRPQGARIVPGSVTIKGEPLNPQRRYRITINNFLASGGDSFTVFKKGRLIQRGIIDQEALAQYLQTHPRQTPAPLNRVQKLE